MKSLMMMTLTFTVFASPLSAQTIAIVGGTVHTGAGAVLEDAVVLIENGRIEAVGAQVTVPAGATRIDAAGKVVTPGLIDLGTQVGLVEVRSLDDTRDESLETDDPFRAAFRVTFGLNPRSMVIPITRLGGVTTVASIPSGGAISGQGSVWDLSGGSLSDMLVRDPAALYAGFNPDAAESIGGARGALALRLREAFDDARFYAAHPEAFDTGALRKLSLSRLDLEALQPALNGALPFVFRASRAADIASVLRIAGEYELDLVLMGAEEGWRLAEELVRADVPVIVKAYANLPLQFDRLGTRFDNAALLTDSGVKVVLSTFDTHNARNLRFEAGQAVRHGMEWEQALRAITLSPAEVLGIDDTHGSLAPGKWANVVVWSGDPFEPASAAEHVFIRGWEIEHGSRQRRLLERYLRLDR